MSSEIEKRFKDFNYKKITKKLLKNEFTKVGAFVFKIINFKGLVPNQRIRIRDEGFRITFTIKILSENSYDTEYEVIVNDYNMIEKMMEQLQLTKLYDLHKFREIYKSNDGKTEVIFDHFPGLPPYMEIESESEKDLFETMKKLNLHDEPKFAAKDLYFSVYGITKDRKDDSLTFENADKLIEYITKNKSYFQKILKYQRDKLIK